MVCSVSRRICFTILAASLALAFPVQASASENDVANRWYDVTDKVLNDENYRAYSYAGSDVPIALSDDNVSTTGSETYYNLRDFGYTTPAKSQYPWNDCWAFGSIAAAESGILFESTQGGMTSPKRICPNVRW